MNSTHRLPPHEENPSEETRLQETLHSFRPHPGQNFYKRMKAAPWSAKENQQVKEPARFPRFPLRTPGKALRVMAAAGAVLILLAASFALPPVRAAALQFMSFFVPASGDHLVVTVSPTNNPGGYNSPGYFSLSMAQAESAAGFQIQILNDLPGGMSFAGAHYDPAFQTVIVRYIDSSRTLFLTELPVGKIQEYASIGASAPVEKVLIHGLPGEFVSGGWKAISIGEQPQETPVPGNASHQVILGVNWDPQLPQRILRWQAGQIQFELLSTGGEPFQKDELIRLAESVH